MTSASGSRLNKTVTTASATADPFSEKTMRTIFYSDNGKPCWTCNGTIVEYETDTAVSLIAVRCIACRARDVFRADPGAPLETAADVSAAHRSTR